MTIPRQLISRADQVFNGRATFGPYQANKPGQEVHLLNRWKPVRNLATTFTAGIAAGATSGTLSANWTGATGLFPITFSDGEVLRGKFLNGNTAVTFYPASPPATGGSYGALTGPQVAVTSAITVGGQPPVIGVANFYSVSASIGAAGSAVLAATVPDVPRNIIGAWTTSSTVTVTGTDYYGQTQTETQTGTAFTGKKAFASITSITSSAAVTAATFGTGNVLGLPFYVGNSGDFFAPVFDGAADAAVAATNLIVGDNTNPATASSGDVRGTYVPVGTLNGAKFLAALIKVSDNTTQVGS
ncbi:MAG TPA: hypothetical protein VK537_07235, partial [Galbitalea sp.]|nr:hypothetical protein [Galbitalea sp.]